MRVGRRVPKGFLPVYSCDTREDAENLLTLACDTNAAGEWVARELAEEQTIENLMKFSDRLARLDAVMKNGLTAGERVSWQLFEGTVVCVERDGKLLVDVPDVGEMSLCPMSVKRSAKKEREDGR